jgi:phospholipid-transporting ATPase
MIHGHWTYRRFSVVAIMMIYKNIVFIFAQFWFAFETLWSPTSYYNDFLMSCYNLFFTVWPPFVFGFWEQDLPQDVLLANPQLYPPERDAMSPLYIAGRCILGIWQSASSYYGIRLLIPRGSIAENGTMTYTAVVMIVMIQVVLWSNAINGWLIGFYIWQIIALVGFIGAYTIIMNWDLMPIIYHGFSNGTVVIGWLVAILIGILPALLIDWTAQYFQPTAVERVRAQTRSGGVNPSERSEATGGTLVGAAGLYTG